MMKIDLTRHAPCGINTRTEFTAFCALEGIAIGLTLPLLRRISEARQELYHWTGAKKVLLEGAVMPDFITLVEKSFFGFPAVMAAALFFVLYHYAFHYQGSKSIYLMRRLPNRWELHRRCWTLPVAAIALFALSAAVMFLLYFAIYLLATPGGCLAPDQWQKIWSVIL